MQKWGVRRWQRGGESVFKTVVCGGAVGGWSDQTPGRGSGGGPWSLRWQPLACRGFEWASTCPHWPVADVSVSETTSNGALISRGYCSRVGGVGGGGREHREVREKKERRGKPWMFFCCLWTHAMEHFCSSERLLCSTANAEPTHLYTHSLKETHTHHMWRCVCQSWQ